VRDSCFVAVCCGLPESRTLKVGEEVPDVTGVPLITPDVLNPKPAGNDPLSMSQVFVPVPPAVAKVVL
jgi:hypothetical protein